MFQSPPRNTSLKKILTASFPHLCPIPCLLPMGEATTLNHALGIQGSSISGGLWEVTCMQAGFA